MPKTKVTSKRSVAQKDYSFDSGEGTLVATTETPEKVLRKRKFLYLLPLIAVVLLAGGYFFKDKFLAATINGKPIFRYELNKRLTAIFGKETLENLIVERLIQKEAKNKAVTVTEKDIEDEIAKLEKNLGAGMKLEDALKMQGVTLADFKNQLKLRFQVNKILEKEITVSPNEIDKYLKDSAKTIVATGESERKEEAKQRLMEQKISERIQTWVSELLAKAKITRFLK